MTQDLNIDRAVHTPRLGLWRRALVLFLALTIVGLAAGRAHADVVGLLVYQVAVFDGKKWHTQKLASGTGLNVSKAE